MRSNIPRMRTAARLALKQRGPATDVLIVWREFTGGTIDPVTGAHTGGTSVVKQLVLRGFVHFVEPASTTVRLYNEVEVGDCIADFAPDAPLDGKAGLTFIIGGEPWVQKEISQALAKSWDLQAGSEKLFRTVLLRKAT
jgi:hypothetical protein